MPKKGVVPYKSLAPQGWGRLPSSPSDLQPLDACKAACKLPTVGSVWELRKAHAPKASKRGCQYSEAAQPTFFMAVATRLEDRCVKVLALQAKSRGKIALDPKDLSRSRRKLRSKWVHCSHLKRVEATRITPAKFRLHVEHESDEDTNLEWLESEHDPDEDWDEASPYQSKMSAKMRSTVRASTRLASCLHAHGAQSGAVGALVRASPAALSEEVWGSDLVQAYQKRHQEREMAETAEYALLVRTIGMWDEGKLGMPAAQHEGEKKRLIQVSKLKALLDKVSLNRGAGAASAPTAAPAQCATYADILRAPAQHCTIAQQRAMQWTKVESTSQKYEGPGFSYNADAAHVFQHFERPSTTAQATNTALRTPVIHSTTHPGGGSAGPSATYSSTIQHDSRLGNASTKSPQTSSLTHRPLVKAAGLPQASSSKIGTCGDTLHTTKPDHYSGHDSTRAHSSKETLSDSSPRTATFDPVFWAGDVCLFADEVLEPDVKGMDESNPGLIVLSEVASRSSQADTPTRKDEGLEREYRMMIERMPIEKASVEPLKKPSFVSAVGSPPKRFDGEIQRGNAMPHVPQCAGKVYTFGDYSVSCNVIQSSEDWPSPLAMSRIQRGVRKAECNEQQASELAISCESPAKGENVLLGEIGLQSPHGASASWSSSPSSSAGASLNLGGGFFREGEMESWSWYYGNAKPLIGAEMQPVVEAEEEMKIDFETRPTPLKKKNVGLNFEQDHTDAPACKASTTKEVEPSFKTRSLLTSSSPPPKTNCGTTAAAQSCMRDPRLSNIAHRASSKSAACGNETLSHPNAFGFRQEQIHYERQIQVGSQLHQSSTSPAANSSGTSKHSANNLLLPPKALPHTNICTLGPYDGVNDHEPLPPHKPLSHTNTHPHNGIDDHQSLSRHKPLSYTDIRPHDGTNDRQLGTKAKLCSQSLGSSPRKMSKPSHPVVEQASQVHAGGGQVAVCGHNQQPSSDAHLKHLEKLGMLKTPSSKNRCWSHQKRWVGHHKLKENRQHNSFEASSTSSLQQQQQPQHHHQQLPSKQHTQHANKSPSAPPTATIKKQSTLLNNQEANTLLPSSSTHHKVQKALQVSFSQEEKHSPEAVRHTGMRTEHPEAPQQALKYLALHHRKRVLLLGQCDISDYVARHGVDEACVDEASGRKSPEWAGDSFEAREDMRRHKAPGGHGVCHCADCEEKIEEYLADSDVDVQEWSSSGYRSTLDVRS